MIASLKATRRESHKAGRLVEKPQVTGWIDSCLNNSESTLWRAHSLVLLAYSRGASPETFQKESVQLRAGFTGSLQGGVFWRS